jgi:hypothetical protein
MVRDGDGKPGAPKRPAREDRRAILARRKFFVASAMAGIAVSGCKSEPQVCLKVATPPGPSAQPTAGPGPTTSEDASTIEPQVCLEVAAPDVPRETDAGPDEPPPPEPRPCLKIAPPDDRNAK